MKLDFKAKLIHCCRMRKWVGKLVGWICLSFALSFNIKATVFYVNASNTVPVSPFTSWDTAATNIQDAIDVASAGDTVMVTNGVYACGGLAVAGNLTNRVALTNAITVQSVNGPWVTSILGAGATNGNSAVRCAWLTNGASLVGFTLAGGATQTSGDQYALLSGGGVWCASTNAFVQNCVVVSNTAYVYGGGIYQGTISGSYVSSNGVVAAGVKGAIYKSILVNCTVVSNSVMGVLYSPAMTNCLVYYNGTGANLAVSGTSFSHCCTFPLISGTANFTNFPKLFADGIHLTEGSPCVGAGVGPMAGTDIFGQVWANPPSIGCSELQPAPLVSQPVVKLSGNPAGFSVGGASISGISPYSFTWLKDGLPLEDDGHYKFTQSTNLVVSGVQWSDAGNYQLVISNAFGVATSAVAQVVIHCVNAAGQNPVSPYTDWDTAATNIQDAIDISAPGDIVLVTNGVYATGGKSMDGVITNRISIDRGILVQSVNGANSTIIQGAWDSATTNGPGAERCAWLTNNAVLSGFALYGGATRAGLVSSPTTSGGGVFGVLTNGVPSATVVNCIIANNAAGYYGGGAYQINLNDCIVSTNFSAGSGGGADACYLSNCSIDANLTRTSGGGAYNCHLNNCAIFENNSGAGGNGVYGGWLVNCSVWGNGNVFMLGYSGIGGVYNTFLTNCIVYDNYGSLNNENYFSSTFSYSDTDPLPTGGGNIDVDPQWLADHIHLAAGSPCIGAGLSNVVSGVDIDGQPWNNPPSMGCDEWQPSPVVAVQPYLQVGSPVHGLTINLVAAGQTPFSCFWSKDGVPIQDDGHYENSGSLNLVVNSFGPQDAGLYQVVVTNSSGVVTSAVAQVVIHTVNASSGNPVPPYLTWDTGATNIQDAINASSAGDIILVTNGVYATGGLVVNGNLTNRVAITLPVSVISVNGYADTVIQGAWDPISTNGPGAIRCAYLVDGAVLNGFTLENGATLATGDNTYGGPLESGGGAYCISTNGIVSNCLLSNNAAIYGAGIVNGTLKNSLVVNNYAALSGGGAYWATMYNCTVDGNYALANNSRAGAGTYNSTLRNCIVIGNSYGSYFSADNCDDSSLSGLYSFICTSPLKTGTGNINSNPIFLGATHISSLSPCCGAGSATYASGFDLNGLPWNNPPSMGCSEVVQSNLVGPLSLAISPSLTTLPVNHYDLLRGLVSGNVSYVSWSFGDGVVATNASENILHQWTNPGNYTVTFTAYNNDNSNGVSATQVIQVQPLNPPQLGAGVVSTNGFAFQFTAQTNGTYTIQYTTSLVPPISWQTLQTIYYSSGGTIQINDSSTADATRYYRVIVQ